MANTYQQVSLRKVRLHHSILTHHLPLYFPEAERYLHSSRAEWFTELLLLTPCPAAVRRYTKAAFVAAAASAGRRPEGRQGAMARRLLRHRRARVVGLPVARGHRRRCACFGSCSRSIGRSVAAASSSRRTSSTRLAGHPDFVRLQTMPGIGPILALIILAEARDLRRFGYVRQFLKYCGFDLCTGAVRAISRDDPPVETRERPTAVRLLDGRRRRHPHAAEQLSPEV